MEKRFYFGIVAIISIIILHPSIALANIICNDGTVSRSCGDCHQGCCSHHGGCSNNSSSNSTNYNTYSNSNRTEQPVTPPKSSDTSLYKVSVDYHEVEVSDNMLFTTYEEEVDIYIRPNDTKATIEYNNHVNLNIGDNTVNIKVTAENNDVKEYKLNVIREKKLSSNKNIEIFVDNKKVYFYPYESNTIYLSNDKNKIDIKYELEDENAKATIIGNNNLKVGKNEVTVRVVAEDGSDQDYKIIVEKYSKTAESADNLVSVIILLGISGSIAYLILHFMKNRKK